LQKLEKVIEVLLLLVVGLPAFLGILVFLQLGGDILWSEKASGWAQAIGAVAAIYFSYRSGLKQSEDALKNVYAADRLAARRKFDAVLAVVDTAEEYAMRLSTIFGPHSVSFLGLCIEYSERYMNDVLDSLQVIPAHELGSYETVSSFLSFRNTMHDLRTNVERVKAKFDASSHGASFEAWIPFDRSPIDLCLANLKQTSRSLHAARGDIA
jgi:hypothetical protein